MNIKAMISKGNDIFAFFVKAVLKISVLCFLFSYELLRN